MAYFETWTELGTRRKSGLEKNPDPKKILIHLWENPDLTFENPDSKYGNIKYGHIS